MENRSLSYKIIASIFLLVVVISIISVLLSKKDKKISTQNTHTQNKEDVEGKFDPKNKPPELPKISVLNLGNKKEKSDLEISSLNDLADEEYCESLGSTVSGNYCKFSTAEGDECLIETLLNGECEYGIGIKGKDEDGNWGYSIMGFPKKPTAPYPWNDILNAWNISTDNNVDGERHFIFSYDPTKTNGNGDIVGGWKGHPSNDNWNPLEEYKRDEANAFVIYNEDSNNKFLSYDSLDESTTKWSEDDFDLKIRKGWNLVTTNTSKTILASEYFADYKDQIVTVWIYDGPNPVLIYHNKAMLNPGSDGVDYTNYALKPGLAFWIYANSDFVIHKNDQCNYNCCANTDCDDNNYYTQDLCSQPNTTYSTCANYHPYMRLNYYDYCWEYDCQSQIPYPKLEEANIPPIVEVNREIKGVENINIIVVFLYGYDPLPEDKINILKSNEDDMRSFRYSTKWFQDKAFDYNVDLNLNIRFSQQQYKVSEDYVIHNYEESFNKDLNQYIIDNFPQYSNYDIVVPFYYNSIDFAFANHAGQNSFTIFSKQYTDNMFYPSFEEETTNYSETFAHELAHLFGTRDKYTCLDTSSSECDYAKQNGVGCIIESENPEELGRDIMCHKVPNKNSEQWNFSTPNLNELVITEVTAKEMGWYDFDDDGIIEVEDTCPFLKENTCQ